LLTQGVEFEDPINEVEETAWKLLKISLPFYREIIRQKTIVV
jgi:hypothetical protein